MRSDSNNKTINIFYVFLLIQPILDLLTSLMVRFTNLPLTIGMVVRGLFLFIMVIYLLFVNKSVHRKKSIIYLGILCIFSILYLITKDGIFTLGFLKTEIIYLFKYMYFPITALCLINAFDELQIKKEKIFKVCIIEAILYSILIILPEITNTAFSSYIDNNEGTVGWFYAANEIGAIMVALFPFLYYLLFERESVVRIALTFTIVILTMTLLGTKTSFLGMLITEILYTLYFLFNYKKNRAYGLKWSIIIIIISFGLIPNIHAVKNLQNAIAESSHIKEEVKEDNEKENKKYTSSSPSVQRIIKVALSGRDKFFYNTLEIYDNANIDDKFLGIGFVNRNEINNKKIEKLIEIDPLDIFFHYGIIGFIILFSPLMYIVYRTLKSIFKNKLGLSFFKFTNIYVIGIITMISMIAGHVYSAPAVSIYVSFAMAMLNSALTKCELESKEKKDKKKITIFALHLGFGGVEKYLSSLCKMLKENYDIEIISTYKVLDKPAFQFSEKVKITYLIDDKPNKEEFKRAIKNKNIISIFKEGVKSVKILYLKRSRNIKAIRNTYSDYIITTRTFHSRLVGYYAYNNIIKIATEHNFHNNDKKYITKVIDSVKDFDYFVVVSDNLRKFYENKIGKTKCIYIPNVIDNLPDKRSKLTNKNIITIGRLSPEKGQKDLIDVFKIVNKELPKTKLFIVGDGPLKQELENYTKKLKLTDKIIFTGFLGNKEKEKYILDSSIFILPSYTESFGLVLIEAMSYGLPCIAFDSSDGARELLKDDVGILVKDRNKEKMATEIIKELKNKDSSEYSDNGYKFCQRYLIDNVKEVWFNILK